MRMIIEDIIKKANDLRTLEYSIAEDIVKYCREQINLWRQVPYLSLMAARRKKDVGHGIETYEYEHCLKIIEGPPRNIAIDLLSGKIVYYDRGIEIDPLDLIYLLRRKRMALNFFDAEAIVEELKKEIKENPDENKEWREKTLKALGLKEISFTRHSMPKFSSSL